MADLHVASTSTDSAPRGRRAFWTLVAGVILNTLALMAWSIGGPLEPGSRGQTVAFFAGVFLQVAAAVSILVATVVGIMLLAKKTRPIVWPMLAALAIPIAFALWLPLVFVVWTILG